MNYHNTNTIRWTPQEGGRLVVRSRYVCYNEPKEVVAFYLIDTTPCPSASPWTYLFGVKLILDATAKSFLMADGDVVHIVREGIPTCAFARAIPKPNGRKNSTIEWRHGSWQKFLEPSTWQEV